MSKGTPATKALTDAKIEFEVLTYDYDPNAPRIGLQAADAMGLPPERVLKTLMTTVDEKPVCVVLASDKEVNLKRLATAVHGKSAAMMKPDAAERMTGYKVGGISPFGQKKRVPVVLDHAAMEHETVVMNGGGRGIQVRVKPRVVVDLLGAILADVAV
jgi:Cys-tRNA(Pro)/Cys-tRNA(Cys) deacylase